MAQNQISTLSVAAALAGAVAIVGLTAAPAEAAREKCFGIAKAGENGCANAKRDAENKSCAGQAVVDYDGNEWKLVPTGTCTEMGGSLEAYDGINPNPSQG